MKALTATSRQCPFTSESIQLPRPLLQPQRWSWDAKPNPNVAVGIALPTPTLELEIVEPRPLGQGQGDRGENQAVADQPSAGHRGQRRAGQCRAVDQDPGPERVPVRIDRDLGVLEAEPPAGQREPRLVDALLGAEQQAVPPDLAVVPAGQPGQLRPE